VAFDFPSAPTVGQIFDAGPTRYQWNGYAWIMQSGNIGPVGPEGPAGPQGPAGADGAPGPTGGLLVEVGDTAPALPADRSMWWQSNTGAFWLRFNDGNSVQWIQVNSNLILPPQDGNEYVMRNGLWRLKSQTLILDGLTQADVAVPAGARFVKFQGATYWPTATANSMCMRVSLDGTNFMQASNDHNHSGFIHYSGSSPTNVAALTGAYPHIYLAYNGNQAVIANVFDARLGLIRTATNGRWDVNAIGSCYGASGWGTNVSRIEIMETNAGSTLAIKALRFLTSLGTAFGVASVIDVEWVY
jgi:hypothetical protein